MDTLNTPPIGQKRRPYRLWLAGIAAGSLLAVMIAPPTGWIARRQVAMQLGIGSAPLGESLRDLDGRGQVSRRNTEERERVLRAHPRDFPVHLAAAMEEGQEERAREGATRPPSTSDWIRNLVGAFPDEPGLYAAALRMDTQGVVHINRPETAVLTGDQVRVSKIVDSPDPSKLAAYDRDAAAGERLEPDNAYFPTMRAVGFYAMNRDEEATAELLKAAECRRWDEHLADELNGKWRLAKLRFGETGAIHTIAVAAAILFPHYAQIRMASRVATLRAMKLEESGHPAEGAKIRKALMRVGDLMRSDATSLIGNLVGIANVAIATERPGGAPPIKSPSFVDEHEREETNAKRIAMLSDYWTKNGLASDVPVARARFETGVHVRKIARSMAANSLFDVSTVARLVLLWCGSALVLTNVWWLLAAGGIGSVALSRRQHRGQERMPRSGPYVLGIAALLFVALCANALVHQWQFVGGMTRMLSALGSMSEGGLREEPIPGLLALILGAAFPALIALGAFIVSVARRVPLRVGLSQGFSRVGLPVACLLILGFCALCVETARWEARVNDAIHQTATHEGRYLARLAGQQWPGPIE